MALKQFNCEVGEGICTDMRAVRKDYFLDHDHSAYVDQWDWERVITRDMRNLDFLRNIVEKIWAVIYEAGQMVKKDFPASIPINILTYRKSLNSFMPRRSLSVSRTLPQAAGDENGAGGVSGDLHHRNRLRPGRRLSHEMRAAITMTGSRPRLKRTESSITGSTATYCLEPGDEAPSRAHVHGGPRDQRHPCAAA